jgi:hypothetical protein
MQPPFERRAGDRLPTPACPECHRAEDVKAVVRTEMVVYFRCAACPAVWSVLKPAAARALEHPLEIRPEKPHTSLG